MKNKIIRLARNYWFSLKAFYRRPRVRAISIALLVLISLVEVWGFWSRNYIGPDKLDLSGWQTYENETYHFQIKYPPGWEVAEFTRGNVAPAFNVYKKTSDLDESKLPYTHFSNATHVSIYPHGIPTEGVSSDRRDSDVYTKEVAEVKRDFLLAGGSPWATIIYFKNSPNSWRDWGFLWAGLAVSNESFECLRENRAIPIENCDPLTGDKTVRYGVTIARDRDIEEKIIATFEFTN